MREQEIVSAVRDTADLTDDHAAAATHATLAVLGTRLADAAPLPSGISEALPPTGQGETFGVEEFYRRVADAEDRGCTPDGAREHARAVVAALKTGVSEDDFATLKAQLPNDFATDLLSTAPANERHD